LRRATVRNLCEKAGVTETQATKITGHKTHRMLRRYNIVSLGEVMDTGG